MTDKIIDLIHPSGLNSTCLMGSTNSCGGCITQCKGEPVSASKYAVTIVNHSMIPTFRSHFTSVVMLVSEITERDQI